MTKTTHSTRVPSGFTLVELLIVMVVFGVVVTGALGFMAVQSKAFYKGADKLTALQNLRFSMDRLESDVQTAGTNLVSGQPWLIHLDSDALAFNADYATNIANDIGAVFYDPGAPSGSVTALQSPITIHGTSFTYGDTTYTDPGSGSNSPGETLQFYFTPDTSTARTDDYMLLRKVNRAPPQLVARHLLQQPGEPFFRYFWNQKDPGQPLHFDSIADTALPWAHIAKDHGSIADTAISAAMDRVRALRVTLRATNGLTGPEERTADLSRVIVMRNAGVEKLKTCGDTPLLGSVGFNGAASDPDGDGTYQVDLSWGPATDESIGERDVIAYTIWRMASTDSVFGDPYLSIPAGQLAYSYTDQSVVSGDSYTYRVAAKDCTPSLSGQATTNAIAIP